MAASPQDLQRRLAALERAIGGDGRRIIDAIVPALGDALRQIRSEIAVERDAAIQKAFETRCVLSYRGTFDTSRTYGRGDTVTDKGAVWTAVCDTTPGERPGSKSTAWRLIAKGQTEPALR